MIEPIASPKQKARIQLEESIPKLPIFDDLRSDSNAVSPKSRSFRVLAQDPTVPKLKIGKSNSSQSIVYEKDKMRSIKVNSKNIERPTHHVLTPKSSPKHISTLGLKQEEVQYTGLINTPKFNYFLKRHLEEKLKDCPDKEVTVDLLNQTIQDYCKMKVEAVFLEEKKTSENQVCRSCQ